MGIFAELADNEPFSCSPVVGVNLRKWGPFRGAPCAAQCAPGWLLGPVHTLLWVRSLIRHLPRLEEMLAVQPKR